MSRLNYNHLRYFWAVAHEGNLTRTAEQLAVSQSALSAQIRKLEERLGHALFERRGRSLHLTEAGRIALDHADRIFSAGEELVGTLRNEIQARQVLRVGAMATLSRNFQVDFLRPVLGRTDVEVVLHSAGAEDLFRGLATLALDIVLTHETPVGDGTAPFVTHRLAEQAVCLVGSPTRLNSESAAEPTRLLQEHPVVLPTRLSSIRTGFDAWVDRLGLSPKIAAEVDDMAMMRVLMREDIGLGVMPAIVVKDELASGLLAQSNP
ncbi:MAG: LysR family transcriptional regulator, partial [Wenzhouxiangella sp.]|nr:LysR family transcriptional regulator [Wenzhouxiangella sp.]